jgi:pyruvate formate lyase activating enzyme
MWREGVLYERLCGSRVRCGVCLRRCIISEGHAGWCATRINKGGRLYSIIYGEVSSISVNPIEKKPVYHFLPGSRWLSLGSWGCNFRCPGCQNWEIAHHVPKPSQDPGRGYLSAEQKVNLALRNGCTGISWTFNEPTLWLEYTIDGGRLARSKALYTNYVTNGAMTEEAFELIFPFLDVLRVDIKGFSRRTYAQIAHLEDFEGTLLVCQRAKQRGMHLEIVTNIIPTVNDSPEELRDIAMWIKEALGDETPWHLTRFMPCLKLSDLPPTPVSTLERAAEEGKKAGLKYVYVGNVPGHPAENTYCPNCNILLIGRYGLDVTKINLKGDSCPGCGFKLYGKFLE